jgi:hypothetical protein
MTLGSFEDVAPWRFVLKNENTSSSHMKLNHDCGEFVNSVMVTMSCRYLC